MTRWSFRRRGNPRHRNANGIEAGGLDRVDQRLADGRVAPGGFPALGFERIAEVPAAVIWLATCGRWEEFELRDVATAMAGSSMRDDCAQAPPAGGERSAGCHVCPGLCPDTGANAMGPHGAPVRLRRCAHPLSAMTGIDNALLVHRTTPGAALRIRRFRASRWKSDSGSASAARRDRRARTKRMPAPCMARRWACSRCCWDSRLRWPCRATKRARQSWSTRPMPSVPRRCARGCCRRRMPKRAYALLREYVDCRLQYNAAGIG